MDEGDAGFGIGGEGNGGVVLDGFVNLSEVEVPDLAVAAVDDGRADDGGVEVFVGSQDLAFQLRAPRDESGGLVGGSLDTDGDEV